MKNLRMRFVLAPAALALLVSCVTVNVYFPAAAIKDLSKQIEEEVQKQAAKDAKPADGSAPADGAPTENAPVPEKKPPALAPQGPGSASLFESLIGITPVYAADTVGNPDVTSPAIRKIIASRAARVDALNALKASGVIGENNKALLEIRNLNAVTDLKARADAQKLVKAENSDREELFREIAAAKKLDSAQIPQIQQTYAATLRDMARPGDWIQMPDGAWKQK